ALLLRIWSSENRCNRSKYDGDQRVDLEESGRPASTHRHHQRRRYLLRRLRARLSWHGESEDRRNEGMGVAERTEITTIRNYIPRCRNLVKRVRRKTQHARSI